MLNRNKWIKDPNADDRFYSIRKNISGRHIVASYTAFGGYKILAEIAELPSEIIDQLSTNPEALKLADREITRSRKERELEKVKAAIARFTQSDTE